MLKTTAIRIPAARLVSATIACLAAFSAGAAELPPPGPGSSASAPLVDSQIRISAERSAVNARFAQQERECRTRFVVYSCIDDAKHERRLELDRLRARQLVVDEARRRERAAARRSELVAKAAEDAKRDAAQAARAAAAASEAASQPTRGRLVPVGRVRTTSAPAAGASAAASGPAPRIHDAGKSTGLGSPPPATESERQAQAARSRAAFESRQRRAVEHREDSAAQAIRRMSSKTPGAALPAPSSASATKR